MGTALLIIALIAAAHYCRLRRDNLAALGFAAAAIFFIWPGFYSFAYGQLTALLAAGGSEFANLIGAVAILIAAAIGLRYIFSANR